MDDEGKIGVIDITKEEMEESAMTIPHYCFKKVKKGRIAHGDTGVCRHCEPHGTREIFFGFFSVRI